MSLDLFPTFAEPLQDVSEAPDWSIPIRPNLADVSLHDILVDDAGKADRLLTLLMRIPIGAIAIDTEFSFGSDAIDLGHGRTWRDPRSIVPLMLSVAIWSPERRKVLRVAFDLRVPDLMPGVAAFLKLDAVFVAHFLEAELHTFWALGIEPVFHRIWDTHVAAKALDLGCPPEPGRHSLARLCARHEIEHPYADAKDALQRSFLSHPVEDPFDRLQVDYALADAEATLRLYLAQQPDVLAAGLHAHLHQVEFPFAEANARMIWDGVPVDRTRLNDLRGGLDRAVDHHGTRLASEGLYNPRSPKQVAEFLAARGHGGRLVHKGKLSTEESVLKRIESFDDAVTDIRRFRRYAALRGDPLFDGSLFGVDGRLHPRHRHLGAATGRNTCSAPNITGVSKTFRPIVTAPPRRALIELDFAQIEVCVAAAVFEDAALLEAANSSDVYAAMAQTFYADDLSDEEHSMGTAAFKTARPDLRDRMKVFVLAVIYNMSVKGVADRFGVSLAEARLQRERFFDRFPGLEYARRQAEEDGLVRGFASITGGLRRWISRGPAAANQLVNTPIQGAAGVVFRRAAADLYRQFRRTSAKLILPVHDAVLIECDLDDLEAVKAEAALIMVMAVRSYFPALRPRVDVNDHDVTCWNKDGNAGSIDRFIEDPTFKL